jgi:hypothetical protein
MFEISQSKVSTSPCGPSYMRGVGRRIVCRPAQGKKKNRDPT